MNCADSRLSLIDPSGAVVSRTDDADTDGWMPVQGGSTVVGLRIGDITVDAVGTATMRAPEVPLAAQSFAAAGTMTVTVTVDRL